MNQDTTEKTAEQQGEKKIVRKTLDDIRMENTLLLLNTAEKGNAPWQNMEAAAKIGMPYTPDLKGNPQEPFTGTNALVLMAVAMDKGFKDPRWVSAEECRKNPETMWIQKGEKATFIEITDWYKRDEKGAFIIGADGKAEMKGKGEKPLVYIKAMFNVSQLENPTGSLAEDKIVRRVATEPNFELAEKIIKDSPVRINHCIVDGGRPRYDVTKDVVEMPKAESFSSKEAYYAEVLHQLAHSTGHKKRNGRDGLYVRPEESRKKIGEELTGEIASFFLRMSTGMKLDSSHQVHNSQ